MLTRLHIGIDYQFCFSFILQISFYWRGCCQSGAVQRNIEYLIKNKYLWSKTKILTTQRKVRAHYLLNCPNTTAAAAAFADDYLWWRWSYWHVIPFFSRHSFFAHDFLLNPHHMRWFFCPSIMRARARGEKPNVALISFGCNKFY